MKFGIILSARSSSKRLPGKATLPLMGLPILTLILRRIKTSRLAGKIVFATSDLPEDDGLAEIAKSEGVEVCRGPLNDVLGRYTGAAKNYDFDYAVRVTGDEPFVDGETLDYVLQKCLDLKKDGKDFDLVTTKPSFPHGIDYEVYPKKLLEKIDAEMNPTNEEREHVTYYIYQKEKFNNYKIIRLEPPENLKFDKTIFLIDTPDDYKNMQKMVEGVNDIHTGPAQFIEIYKKLK